MNNTVILAFSGGLDTSFCVPYLLEQGYRVVTAFIDSGGVSNEERNAIKTRALELGAAEHREINIADQLWDDVVKPLIYGSQWYQDQYPLLCSDRYLIVAACLELCDELNTNKFAHGCTGMGNDQIRFDLTVKCLGDYEVLSPIREIQRQDILVRDYEMDYLKKRGFSVPVKAGSYSINENLLGTTISGSEIDEWKQPGEETYAITAPQKDWPDTPLFMQIHFHKGVATSIDGVAMKGAEILSKLNNKLGQYGLGRGIYTGDTTVGLKGRIVFEAPAIEALKLAHRALEETVVTKAQNRFKSSVAQKWTELVYEGLFHDPLKTDLEAYLESSQQSVNGEVTLEISGGRALAVEVNTSEMLINKNATYAQSSDWTVDEAQGFIKLFGQSSTLYTSVVRDKKSRQKND